MRELTKMGGLTGADSELLGGGGNLLSRIGDDEEMGGGERRIVKEPSDIAVETFAARMAKLRMIPGVSRGISFGIDHDPDGPRSSWSVVLHRGPLPLLAIELSDVTGFQPPRSWLGSIVHSDCAHVVHRKGSYSGTGDQLFLIMKRRSLFPYSKGNAGVDAVAAGRQLRDLCGEVWRRQAADPHRPCDLSYWNWRRRRFVREFDAKLLEHTGRNKLDEILRRMGTRLESWLAA